MGQRSALSMWTEYIWRVPPVQKRDLTGKVVIVTGANTGIGFEAAKHFATMNPAKLILACRNKEKGEAALQRLKEATKFEHAELWTLDLLSFESVKVFADRFDKEVGTLDYLVTNAAMGTASYRESEDGYEAGIQANFMSHWLLSVRLLPSMIKAARESTTTPRIVFVTSGLHQEGKVPAPALSSTSPLRVMSDKELNTPYDGMVVYPLTKLLNVLHMLSFKDHLPDTPKITVNAVCPGFCVSELRREFTGPQVVVFWILEKIFGRTSEEGSRQYLYAALGNQEKEESMHGAYFSSMIKHEPGAFVVSEEGRKFREVLWDDCVKTFSDVDPKVKPIIERYLSG
ncbi:hypothetical protein ONZ45_g11986 [Pleurotus djamor]|nr:hypothetical protein ONZ45_g11986 [Pleurotus djamor]